MLVTVRKNVAQMLSGLPGLCCKQKRNHHKSHVECLVGSQSSDLVFLQTESWLWLILWLILTVKLQSYLIFTKKPLVTEQRTQHSQTLHFLDAIAIPDVRNTTVLPQHGASAHLSTARRCSSDKWKCCCYPADPAQQATRKGMSKISVWNPNSFENTSNAQATEPDWFLDLPPVLWFYCSVLWIKASHTRCNWHEWAAHGSLWRS